MSIVVEPVESREDRRRFVNFPRRLYRDNPFWVPPLRSEIDSLLDTTKNPFHEHADVQLFLAHNDGRVIGRIAGCENRLYNEYHSERTAVFGLFEVESNYEYAVAMLETVSDWARKRGLELLRGPMSFSTNEECGLLTEGFDSPPCVLMPYNPPYYEEFLQRFGFSAVKDLLAFVIERQKIPERLNQGAEMVMKRTNARVRCADLKNFDKEIPLLHQLYREGWGENWGFSPMTPEEFQWRAERMKMLADPDLVPILEVDDEPIGFAVVIPDINRALLRTRNWPDLARLGWLAARLRFIKNVRVLMLGLRKDYRRLGLDTVLYWHVFKTSIDKGLQSAELSWVLDNNDPLLNAFRYLNAEQSKVYRLYDRPLQDPPTSDKEQNS